MKIKNFIFIVLFNSIASAEIQSSVSGKNNLELSGNAGFMYVNSLDDLQSNDWSLSIEPQINYYIKKGIYTGARLGFSIISPHSLYQSVGICFGKVFFLKNIIKPDISVGFKFFHMKHEWNYAGDVVKRKEYDPFIDFGIKIMFNRYAAVNITNELSYQIIKIEYSEPLKDYYKKYLTDYLKIGISIFLF